MANDLPNYLIDGFNRAHKGSNLNVSDLYEIYKTHDLSVANKIIDGIIGSKNDVILNNEKLNLRDPTLNITDFKEIEFVKNRDAIARIIHHVLITNPGTYPNNPDFGVGIERFLFELTTEGFKASLESEINKQIAKWITKPIRDTDINIHTEINYLRSDNDAYITLALFFKVTEKSNNSSDNYDINLYLTGNNDNKKVISKIEI